VPSGVQHREDLARAITVLAKAAKMRHPTSGDKDSLVPGRN
jgi:hypothetical protein